MRYGKEIIKKLEKTSSTVATLPSGSKLTIGGQKYVLTSALTIDTSIVGAGGLESALAINTFYYVYAVDDGGVIKLIATPSEVKPSAFDSYKKVGAFLIELNSLIFEVRHFGQQDGPIIEYTAGSGFAMSNSGMSIAWTSEHCVFQLRGGRVKVNGRGTVGTNNTNTAYIVLPWGLLVDNVKSSTDNIVGGATRNVASTASNDYRLISWPGNDRQVYFTTVNNGSYTGLQLQNWNQVLSSTDYLAFEFEVAILGLPENIDWNLY